jgi:outer membrane protein assembly factor BamB
MDSSSDKDRWVVCPVCYQPNRHGLNFCEHCQALLLHDDTPISHEEALELSRRRTSKAKTREMVRISAIILGSLALVFAAVYPPLYFLTDVISPPPAELNSSSGPGEWAMFRHDLARTGASGANTATPRGEIKWTFPAGTAIHSSPAVANGNIYFGARDGKLYAVDAATGTKQWEFQTGSWVESSPAVSGGAVYFGSNDGNLYALTADSGQKLWEFDTNFPVMSSPAVADGRVHFGGDDYYVYTLDARDGTEIWSFYASSPVISSPVVSDGILYVGTGTKFFYAFNAHDGRRRLRFNSHYSTFTSAAVGDGTVYFLNSAGLLYAFDGQARSWPREHEIKPYWLQMYVMGLPVPFPPPQSGELWIARVGPTGSSSPLLYEDTIYASSESTLVATDIHSEEQLWAFEAGGTIRSSPAIANGILYVGSEDGKLYALDAATGEKQWEIATGGLITSSPAVVDSVVYVTSHDGTLYAIE